MKKIVKGVGVDAGIIMICDIDYYKKFNKEDDFEEDSDISSRIKVPVGTHQVLWKIARTWNGKIEGEGNLKVTSGNVIVSDPCYCIRDDMWNKWLNITNYGKNEPDGCIIIDQTGGDGCFNVNLDIG